MGTHFLNGQPTDDTRNSAGDNYLVAAESIGTGKLKLRKQCGNKSWRASL
jgi:hypothetical protein